MEHRVFGNYAEFHRQAYAASIKDSRDALGVTLLRTSQPAGRWVNASTPDLVIGRCIGGRGIGVADLGSGRFRTSGRVGEAMVMSPGVVTSFAIDAPHGVLIFGLPYQQLRSLDPALELAYRWRFRPAAPKLVRGRAPRGNRRCNLGRKRRANAPGAPLPRGRDGSARSAAATSGQQARARARWARAPPPAPGARQARGRLRRRDSRCARSRRKPDCLFSTSPGLSAPQPASRRMAFRSGFASPAPLSCSPRPTEASPP